VRIFGDVLVISRRLIENFHFAGLEHDLLLNDVLMDIDSPSLGVGPCAGE
jgi:hypothetical protein